MIIGWFVLGENRYWIDNEFLTSLAMRFSSLLFCNASCFSANNSASLRSCSFLRNSCHYGNTMCKHEKAEKGLTMLCVTQSFTHGKISHTGGRNNKTWCLWAQTILVICMTNGTISFSYRNYLKFLRFFLLLPSVHDGNKIKQSDMLSTEHAERVLLKTLCSDLPRASILPLALQSRYT